MDQKVTLNHLVKFNILLMVQKSLYHRGPGMYKNLVNNGINYQPQLVQDFPKRKGFISQSHDFSVANSLWKLQGGCYWKMDSGGGFRFLQICFFPDPIGGVSWGVVVSFGSSKWLGEDVIPKNFKSLLLASFTNWIKVKTTNWLMLYCCPWSSKKLGAGMKIIKSEIVWQVPLFSLERIVSIDTLQQGKSWFGIKLRITSTSGTSFSEKILVVGELHSCSFLWDTEKG